MVCRRSQVGKGRCQGLNQDSGFREQEPGLANSALLPKSCGGIIVNFG